MGPSGVVAAGVRWFGRVDADTDATRPRFSWSGTGFVARFMGTSLAARLDGGSALSFKVVIDGTPQPAFRAVAGTARHPLATSTGSSCTDRPRGPRATRS